MSLDTAEGKKIHNHISCHYTALSSYCTPKTLKITLEKAEKSFTSLNLQGKQGSEPLWTYKQLVIYRMVILPPHYSSGVKLSGHLTGQKSLQLYLSMRASCDVVMEILSCLWSLKYLPIWKSVNSCIGILVTGPFLFHLNVTRN